MTALAHRPFGAELLAAETVYADAPVDLRFPLLHCDCLGGTDLRALATADAGGCFEFGKRRNNTRYEKVRNLSEETASQHLIEHVLLSWNRLEIRDDEL